MGIRKLKRLIKVCVLLIAASTLWFARSPVSASQSPEPINIVPFGSSLAEKLGKDDSPSLIVNFSGDIHGNLDICSCKGRLLGGLARRVSFSKLFNANYKDVPVVLVDTGGFLMDRTGEHGFLRNFSTVRDRWTVQGYEKYGYALANVSRHELPYLASLAQENQPLPKYPGREELKLVSANLSVKNGGSDLRIVPYLILNASTTGSNPIKVAFVGLSDDPESSSGTTSAALQVTDPIQAVKKYVPEVRSKADVVIVVAHLKAAKAIEVAHATPGIDVLICGNEDEFTRPIRVDKTLVVFTSYETHLIGELRFYRSAEGPFASKDRYITLDNTLTDDPEATKFVADMVAEVKDSTKKFESAGPSRPPQSGSGNTPSQFVGASECYKCHQAQYMTWVNSPHAHATASLAPKTDELETGCFVCHATGFGKGGFSEGGPVMKYNNVQCEQCHGPALDHIAKPDKNYGKISAVGTLCTSCHTNQTNPSFDPKAAWELIK
ncbi:MAG TPA: multiheme c-type cytochrome, partial [Blastocatellia bacterium]|nr:multiheme c-type cytochrome [Blastocatellia bacterium]